MLLLLAVDPAMFMVRRSRILSCVLHRRSYRLALQNISRKILKNEVSGGLLDRNALMITASSERMQP
jgi:hypothetical protein